MPRVTVYTLLAGQFGTGSYVVGVYVSVKDAREAQVACEKQSLEDGYGGDWYDIQLHTLILP